MFFNEFSNRFSYGAVQLLKQTDSGIKQHKKKNVGDLEITQVTIETDAAAQKIGQN